MEQELFHIHKVTNKNDHWSNNKIINDIQEEIKKELLKISLENNIPLDEAYQRRLQKKF